MLKKLFCSLLVGIGIVGSVYAFYNTKEQNDIKPYITITQTEYKDDEQTEMVSNCIVYDLTTKELKKVGQVPYTSATPLTAFSSRKNAILFTARSSFGDQIYQAENDGFKQLTNQFSDTNHMFQIKDNLFLLSRYLLRSSMEPVVLNLKTNELKRIYFDETDDRFSWVTTCDPINNKAYFTAYSDTELRENMSKYNKENHKVDDDSPLIPSISTFYSVDMETLKVEPVFTSDEYIHGIAASNNDFYYASSESAINQDKGYALYHVDLKTKEKTKIDAPVYITTDMAVWDNILYCIGWLDKKRGVYSVDLETLETNLIYAPEYGFNKAFVNQISLNC